MSLFKAMGSQSQVERLEEKIDQLYPHSFYNTVWKPLKPLIAAIGGIRAGGLAASCGLSTPLSCAVGAGVSLAVLSPAARRPANLLGVAVGVTASAVGLAALPAVGVGLGTAIVTRIPLMKSAALGVVRAGIAIGEAGVDAIEFGVDVAIHGVALPVIKGLFNGVYGAVSAADRALDIITLQK